METRDKKVMIGVLIVATSGGLVGGLGGSGLEEHFSDDVDRDDIEDDRDNCPSHHNTNQADEDEDGIGDMCDRCPREYGSSVEFGCPVR